VTLNPGVTTPTVKFTFHSGNSSRTISDSYYFGQVTDGTGTADCTGINGSFSSGTALDTDTSLTVNGCSSSATDITIKDTSNGNAVVGTVSGLTPGWGGGDQVVTPTAGNLNGLANHILKAVQTIAGVESRLSTAPSITPASSAVVPDLTSITTPVYSDAATVTVNGFDPTSTRCKIYDVTVSTVVGDHTFTAGPSSEAIAVSGLVQGHTIKATQFVGGNESPLVSAPSAVVSGPICTSVANVGGITTPIYDNATTVTVTGVSPNAALVSLYHNATLLGSTLEPGGGTTPASVVVSGLALTSGWTISAVQTIGGQASCTGVKTASIQPICASVANVGGFTGPLNGGASTITVNGCSASASLIKVYQGASVVGTAAGGAATVAVPCTGLTKGSTAKATQIVGSQESCLSSAPSSATIGSGAPNKVRFCIGLRNTTGAAAPLGTDSGTPSTGTIYFLGASAGQFGQYVGPTGIPAKNIVTADSSWHTVSFNPGDPSWNGSSNAAGSPVGNAGAGGSSWATLEGLYIVPDDPTDTGEYRVYIDNIVNGTQGVLQDFEAATVGTVGVTFSNPSASGTTGGSLLGTPTPTPNTTVVTTALADTGAQCDVVDFQFKDTNAGNWLRLNTVNAAVQKNPSVDITQPITMRVRLYSPTLNVTQVDATHLQFAWSSTWGLVKRGSLTSGTWTAVAGTSPLTVTISQADPPTFFRLQAP
jgi:hypothetical protein